MSHSSSTRFSLARKIVLVFAFASLAFAVFPVGCGGAGVRDEFEPDEAGTSGGPSDPVIGTDSGPGIEVDGNAGCLSLQCQVVTCDGGQPSTTVTGTVYDPAGRIPLYNAIVYVPVYPDLPEIVQGATCDRCGTLTTTTVTSALTDVKGNFKLENVPVGADIPVVVQVGKWRKVVRMKVDACKVNELEEKLTLPKNQQEGSMPRFAVSTGSMDGLACLLNRIGIDDEEFTLPDGGGAVHVYSGSGFISGGILDSRPKVQGERAPGSHDTLWDSAEHLAQYDVVLLACEGDVYASDKNEDDKARMRDYLNGGGRVFATHYHATWFKDGPEELQTVASWGPTSAATTDEDGLESFTIDRTFPKGEAFGDWLELNDASDDGETIMLGKYATSVDAANDLSQQWIYGSDDHPVKYISFNTPVEAEPAQQCGRAVLSDIHVGADKDSNVPSGCSGDELTDQEKALLFLLMDLSSCVQDDDTVPEPPN